MKIVLRLSQKFPIVKSRQKSSQCRNGQSNDRDYYSSFGKGMEIYGTSRFKCMSDVLEPKRYEGYIHSDQPTHPY